MNIYLQFFLIAIITIYGDKIVVFLLKQGRVEVDKFQQSRLMKKQVELNKIIDRVQNFVDLAVTSVAETYVNALKKDQAFTPEAKKEAEQQAINIIKGLMTKDEFNTISSTCENLDSLLSEKIKNTVDKNKTIADTTTV
jgi:hypothetical protein